MSIVPPFNNKLPEASIKHITNDTTLNILISTVDAMCFCFKDMLLCEEIINPSITNPLEMRFPGLVRETVQRLKRRLSKPEYGGYSKEARHIKLSCTWPEHLMETLLLRLGVSEDDLPFDKSTSKILDENQAAQFLENLVYLHYELYNKLTEHTGTYMGLGPEKLPASLILEAVHFAQNNEDFIADRPFCQWLPDALQSLPPDRRLACFSTLDQESIALH